MAGDPAGFGRSWPTEVAHPGWLFPFWEEWPIPWRGIVMGPRFVAAGHKMVMQVSDGRLHRGIRGR